MPISNSSSLIYRPVILVVLDGYGESEITKGNPVKSAQLPTFNKLNQYYPKMLLQASSVSVGLPWGEPGNSEVGHQALGSGVIIYQNLPRINLDIESGKFYQHEKLKALFQEVKTSGKKMHFMGLVSDGGVHSHINHLKALLETAKEQGLENVFVHAFMDGRDTPPNSGTKYLREIEEKMDRLGAGKLASVMGRYYAMDRNKNWDRIEKAFRCLTMGEGTHTNNPVELMTQAYRKDISDERLEPMAITSDDGKPIGLVEDGDVILFFNFRKDRARQITKAFTDQDFKEFSPDTSRPKLAKFATMTEYDDKLHVDLIIYPPMAIKQSLGHVLSENGKTQLRIAETEKYAHVTYYFNVGREEPFPKEDHILIHSKNVPSYDKLPEMGALEITEKLETAITQEHYDFILVNYANLDMVAHTGNFSAAVKALEIVDECLNRLIKITLAKNGCLLITADHGNVEEMINLKTGVKDTEHSINPVPLWWVAPNNHHDPRVSSAKQLPKGILSDVAPTVLDLMQIKKPSEMTGNSLLDILKSQV